MATNLRQVKRNIKSSFMLQATVMASVWLTDVGLHITILYGGHIHIR